MKVFLIILFVVSASFSDVDTLSEIKMRHYYSRSQSHDIIKPALERHEREVLAKTWIVIVVGAVLCGFVQANK